MVTVLTSVPDQQALASPLETNINPNLSNPLSLSDRVTLQSMEGSNTGELHKQEDGQHPIHVNDDDESCGDRIEICSMLRGSTGERALIERYSGPKYRERQDVRIHWVSEPDTFLLIKKPKDDGVSDAMIELGNWLHSHGKTILVEPSVITESEKIRSLSFLQTWHSKRELRHLPTRVHMIICLGGDGTMLWASKLFPTYIPPVLSFSLGSLGFLSPFSFTSYREVLSRVFQGHLSLTMRSRILCKIIRGKANLSTSSKPLYVSPSPSPPLPEESPGTSLLSSSSSSEEEDVGTLAENTYVCMNEVVVDRGLSTYLTNLDCSIDGVPFTKVEADGIIIATPTGSTAYSLSAGGSMVHPDVSCFLFTPICPHSLSFRPLLFPDTCTLSIQVNSKSRGSNCVAFDGRERVQLRSGDELQISISKWSIAAICRVNPTKDWFHAVKNTLNWNSRMVNQKPMDDFHSNSSGEASD